MNLQRLFEKQAELDAHIEKEHPRKPGEDRLAKKILALQVELGELANEWRGFKFWSYDQEPRVEDYSLKLDPCADEDDYKKHNPLLEEYVDGLHFFLSIGNEMGVKHYDAIENVGSRLKNSSVIFAILNKRAADMWWNWHDHQVADFQLNWLFGFGGYLWLAELLGFSHEEVEQAYADKNATNHARQESGY